MASSSEYRVPLMSYRPPSFLRYASSARWWRCHSARIEQFRETFHDLGDIVIMVFAIMKGEIQVLHEVFEVGYRYVCGLTLLIWGVIEFQLEGGVRKMYWLLLWVLNNDGTYAMLLVIARLYSDACCWEVWEGSKDWTHGIITTFRETCCCWE